MSPAAFNAVVCAAALAALWWLIEGRAAGASRRARARTYPRARARARVGVGALEPGRGALAALGPGIDGAAPAPARVPPAELPLLCDAVAALVESGLSVEAALEAAGEPDGPAPSLAAVGARLRWGSPWQAAWDSAPGCARLEAPLRLSAHTGAPAAALLRDAAGEARRQAAREHEAMAGAMTVRLVLPLGLCALPAFVCLGIVPVALALLPWF